MYDVLTIASTQVNICFEMRLLAQTYLLSYWTSKSSIHPSALTLPRNSKTNLGAKWFLERAPHMQVPTTRQQCMSTCSTRQRRSKRANNGPTHNAPTTVKKTTRQQRSNTQRANNGINNNAQLSTRQQNSHWIRPQPKTPSTAKRTLSLPNDNKIMNLV